MANKAAAATGTSSPQGSLQRGKACLRCRKRKMRCDGTKPACLQCVRAKKGDACEFDDGKGKTRTQILKETIHNLQRRVRELEDPEGAASATKRTTGGPQHETQHHRPLSFHQSESSSSSLGSPSSITFSGSHSPFPADSPPQPWMALPGTSHSPFGSEVFFDGSLPVTPTPTPFELAPILLDIFAPHRHQCGLELQMDELRDSLTLPLEDQRHPSLMNAIYLWACFISRPQPLSEHEDYFLARALEAQQEGLRMADKITDVVRASCLLALYFLATGRVLEGGYHSSAAAALAMQMGLHMDVPIEPLGFTGGLDDLFAESKPLQTDIRRGERVLAFWQVYFVDRCWSVALRRPAVMPDGSSASHAVNLPWPQDLEDYASGYIDSPSFQTVARFLSGDVGTGGFSMQSLRAKACTLFAHADILSRSWESGMNNPTSIREDIQRFEMTITRFLATLPSLQNLDPTVPSRRQMMITVHTLANTATILLHQHISDEMGSSYTKCIRAANACMLTIKSLSQADFELLDPIVGSCWTVTADILLRQLDALEATWPPVNTADVCNELGTMLFAMNGFNSHFPILNLQISKLQERLER